MSRVIKTGRWLDCGCCGESFTVWKGYKDQDQDKGYGICSGCQGEITEQEEERMTSMINMLASALSEESKASFLAESRKEQESFVMGAIDKGFLKWSFGPA